MRGGRREVIAHDVVGVHHLYQGHKQQQHYDISIIHNKAISVVLTNRLPLYLSITQLITNKRSQEMTQISFSHFVILTIPK